MTKEKLRSPLRLPNGKFNEKDRILNYLPSGIKEFRDVKMGAGHVSFHIMNNKPKSIEKFWLNDENKDLINFFEIASNFTDELIKMIRCEVMDDYLANFLVNRLIYDGEALFRNIKHEFNKQKISSDPNLKRLAMCYFIINRLAFAGSMTGGFCADNYVTSKTSRLNKASVDRIKSLEGFIKSGVHVTSTHHSVPILAGSKYKDDEVFLFINPPFYNPKMQMYNKSVRDGNMFDYEGLAKMLAATKYKWLMVIDDSEYIRKTFGFANVINEFDIKSKRKFKKTKNKIKPKSLIYISNY